MTELILGFLLYLGLGVAAGVVAGLLGVGGGIIIVPTLVWTFHLQGISDAVLMHLAVGTSHATIIITSLASVRAHHRRAAVLWPVFRRLTPGIVLGALLGVAIADALAGETLKTVFGVFLLIVATQMGIGLRPPPHRQLPGTPGMLATGGVIGGISAMVGIGGGSLTVPFLTWCNTSIRNAVATSSACGLPIALASAAGFMVAGWGEQDLPAWSAGYVYGPALLGIVAASMQSAPLGAKLAHTLPMHILKRVFAAFLAIVGVNMLMD